MRHTERSPEVVALQALAWVAGQDELWQSFLAASGAAPSDVHARAQEPAFLIALLDFLMMEDTWVIDFCQAAGLPYDAPALAREGLPGGQRVHWT